MRFGQIDWLDHRFEPFTVASVPDAGLPELAPDVAKTPGLTVRDARLLRLGAKALAECLGPARLGGRPPLVLALPEPERQRPLDAGRFLKLFATQSGGAFDLAAKRDGDHRPRRWPRGGRARRGDRARREGAVRRGGRNRLVRRPLYARRRSTSRSA